MTNAFIARFALQFNVPEPAARQFATEVAERCALVANRYEPEGIFTMDQLSAVETIGSEIGSAIIQTFAPADHVD